MHLDANLVEAFMKKYGTPGAKFIPFPENEPTAIYHPIFEAPDKSMSIMAVLIGKVEEHSHAKTIEHYFVVNGQLDFLKEEDGIVQTHIMRLHESANVRADVVHRSQSLNGGTELIVISTPAWMLENHRSSNIKIERPQPEPFPDLAKQ